ncbi:MAG TPA: hypothetical protein VF444_20265, partial [Pseudonocardiaceae bacterium]
MTESSAKTPTNTASTNTAPAGLCGFSRCRAPLPPPGSKGGRPFEYCPDRTWPGGKTCKQLAAAQDALEQAFGEPVAAQALTGAAATFTATAERLLDPLGEVRSALEAMRTATEAELAAATKRVEEAEATATTERGLRQSAEHRGEEAEAASVAAQQAARDAEERARQHQQAREEAREL